MLKFMFLLLSIFLSLSCYASDYYVFNTENKANAALNYINAKSIFPITGKNARTGRMAHNKAKTLRWADAPWQRADGTWVFPRIPDYIRATLDVEETAAFVNAFSPAIENYHSDWVVVTEYP